MPTVSEDGSRADLSAGAMKEGAAKRRCEAHAVTVGREALEEAAATTVAAVLGATWELHDTAGRSGAYDFTIIRAQSTSALEVTQATDFATERFFAALEKHGSSFEAPTLTNHWIVTLDTPGTGFGSRALRHLQGDLVDALSTLEASGAQEFNCHRPDGTARDICEQHDFLTSGATFDMDGPPQVWLNHSTVFSFAASDLVEAAEARASLDDNRAKLAASRFDERHLFVWINVWEFAASTVFAQGTPPPRDPVLPEEITHLWIARLADDEVVVWLFSEGQWTYHKVPTEVRHEVS